jgi:hypothetical protein
MYVALDAAVHLAYWGKIVVDESGMKHGTAWGDTVVGEQVGPQQDTG